MEPVGPKTVQKKSKAPLNVLLALCCRWMQVQSYCKACPVCKAGVEVDKVVPIYGRGSDKHSLEAMKEQPVPPRPAGQRTAEPQVLETTILSSGACLVFALDSTTVT